MTSVMSDAVIVGAGPAGLATAIALRAHGLSVCVVERETRPRARIGETVPGDLGRALNALGAWDAFLSTPHLVSAGNASAWGTTHLARRDAFSEALGGGWHIDRARFELLLDQRARGAGASVRRGWNVRGVAATRDGGWGVHALAGGHARVAHGRVLVDATGREATVARWLGARRHVHDRLVCAYRVFSGQDVVALDGWTLVEAVRDGWWYAAPLPSARAMAAVFTDPSTCRTKTLRDADGWQRAWLSTTHLCGMLAHTVAPKEPGLAAVTVQCLERAAGEAWIAVGDAAASTDPLTSAGITLALRDGIRAAAAIAARQAGVGGALYEHAASIRRRFANYLIASAAYYGLEDRWLDSRFWQDRRELQVPVRLTTARPR
jgi:flavin-dependent dehydrogenase